MRATLAAGESGDEFRWMFRINYSNFVPMRRISPSATYTLCECFSLSSADTDGFSFKFFLHYWCTEHFLLAWIWFFHSSSLQWWHRMENVNLLEWATLVSAGEWGQSVITCYNQQNILNLTFKVTDQSEARVRGYWPMRGQDMMSANKHTSVAKCSNHGAADNAKP